MVAAQQSEQTKFQSTLRRLGNLFRSASEAELEMILRRHKGSIDLAVAELSGNSQPSSMGSSTVEPERVEIKTLPPAPIWPSPVSKKTPKPKKNERSTIYANRQRERETDSLDRGQGSQVKHPRGGSESDAGDGSGAESDGSWSGDEGRRKRRRVNDEVDAEGAALAAFNDNSADLLTGTIGLCERA